jgi:hypothetical protein
MFYFRHTKRRRAGNLDYRLDPETSGKWVISGNRGYIGGLWKKARDLVREGELYEVKYTRFSRGKWGLLVYADNQTKEDFLAKMKGFNVSPYWISNDRTRFNKKLERRFGKSLTKLISYFY